MMVCLGNICRSPIAHGILQDKIEKLQLPWAVDSCGTSSWHTGERPDSRSIEVALKNDINIADQRAQNFDITMFEEYDHILVMDSNNHKDLMKLAKSEAAKLKVSLLMNYAFPGQNRQVPDPYYEGGFDVVFEMIEQAINEFIATHT
jgi:protein-tyrosine phosphatase